MAKNKKVANKKFRLDRANIIFIIGIIVLLIPLIFFSSVLIGAHLNTGKIFSGERFKEDLNPTIKDNNIENLELALTDAPKVSKHAVDLTTATLKVFLEFEDGVDKNEIITAINFAYVEIDKELPIADYFTSIEGEKRQYDLEIHGFNLAEDENFIYFIYKKGANAEEPYLQLMSEPIDPDYTDKVIEHFNEQQNQPEEDDDLGEDEGLEEAEGADE